MTPLATSTSMAVFQAGRDRAWVSLPMKSGPVMPWDGAVLHDRLRRRGDVGVVERGVQAGAAMSGGAEDDLLVGVGRVGREVVVGADHGVDVDQVFGEGRLAGAGMSHGGILPTFRLAGARWRIRSQDLCRLDGS